MSGDFDETTRRCPECGESFTGRHHAGCRGTSQRLADWAKTPPSAPAPVPGEGTLTGGHVVPDLKAHEEEYPQEVRIALRDSRAELNQYVLVQQVGRGGMGTVWRAFDRKLLRWVAIKFLIEPDDEGTRRFTREAQIAARLRHPNIAPVYEVGDAKGQRFIVMDFIDGAPLGKESIPLRNVLEIFVKVCAAVQAAHDAGVIHRDLKPQNIMVARDGTPFVMDFGLSKAMRGSSSLSASGTVIGTPAFMPPEQAAGRIGDVDMRSDVYSLGASMYAVLTREHPFQAAGAMEVLFKVIHEDAPTPRSWNPGIPVEVETIILKAMSKEKELRYESAAALGADIARHLAGDLIEARRAPAHVRILRAMRRHTLPVVAVAALAAGMVFTALLLSRPSGEEQWLKEWIQLRARLDYGRWDPSDSALPSAAQTHLRRMAREAAIRDADGALEWIRTEVDKASKDTNAARAASWLAMMEPSAAGTAVSKEIAAQHVLVAARAEGARWRREWAERRETLTDVAAVKRVLDAMPADAAAEVDAWFKARIQSTADDVAPILANAASWPAARARMKDVVAWCDAVAQLGRGGPALEAVRADAARILDFRGRVTLRIAAAPWAEALVFVDGRSIPLAQRATPLVVPDLEIGAIRIELKHPDHPARSVSIEAASLKDGGVYVVSGSMKSGALAVTPE